MMRHVLVCLVALAVGRPALAKGVVKTTQRLTPPIGCTRLSIAEGLPNSNVRAIVQDRLGFLWFGTQDGVARYDGIRMRVYRPGPDPSSISGGYITALTLDPSGEIWVGTSENGVNLYDPETDKFTRFTAGAAAGALTSEGVTSIARDKKGRVWFAMSGGGLNRYEPATKTFSPHKSTPLDVAITSIAADEAGNLWLGTASEGVIRWNPDTSSATSYGADADADLVAAGIPALYVSPKGTIWIGTDGKGLYALDTKTNKLARYQYSAADDSTIGDDHIAALYEDKNGTLWIGTPKGLDRMKAPGNLIRYQHDANDPTSLVFPAVESIFQDAGGVMWAGGLTVGLCRFDEFRLRFNHHHTRTDVSSFFEDTDKSLWVGTFSDGLRRYERDARRVTLYQRLGQPNEPGSVPLESVWITDVYRDRRGTLWILLKGQGLVAFDHKNETYRQYMPDPQNPNSIPVDWAWDIREDSKGNLWLATWGGGLVRFDPQTEAFTSFNVDANIGITSNHIYALYPDPVEANIIWLGTAKGGLVRFDMLANTATSVRHKADDPASLSSDDVSTIYREPSGILWVGTYGGGLNRLDLASKKVERYTTANSKLTNDMVLGILPDENGKLWLSTNGGGLLQLDPQTRAFRPFQKTDGLQDNEFGQGTFLRSKSGELFFGGPGGWNAFFPKDIKRYDYVPPVAMTAFKVFNQEVNLGRPIWTLPTLDLSYSDSFEVQFAALSFAAPDKNRYAYKLEGFDDKFIETDHPFATYTKLDGGNYTLRVRAANHDGVWNETGIALKLAVAPPLWRTWPAYGVYILIIAGLAYLVLRWQQQRVRRAEREGRLAVVERDLELTGVVQSGFLPEHNEIRTPAVQLFGFYRPADSCSGDWWWHERLSDGRHVVMVGDVTGHGPGPAMVTAAVATAFRVLIGTGLGDMRQGLELLNREVLRVAKGKYHMTMIALEIDEISGRWILHSAGAPPMLSLNHTGKHRVHFCAGSPLGTETQFETGWLEGVLEPRERILLYTDGIPELTDREGNVLGMRRFAQMYERTQGYQLHEAATAMVHHADQIRGVDPQRDDWTFTIIEFTANRPALR